MDNKKTSKKKDKQRIRNNKTNSTQNMVAYLSEKWKNKVTWSCDCCLQEAYNCEMNETQGYVTDEELINSSNHKLKPK